MTDKEKIAIYENFLHQINYAVTASNNTRVKELVDRAFKWSYSHRAGNGEYSEEDQQRMIDNATMNLIKEKAP